MTTNYNEEMSAVKSDLQRLKEDITKLTKSAANDAQVNASAFSAKAKDKVKLASKRTKEMSMQGRDRAHETVAANPLVSIAATAGIALIIGALIARR
ncbi:DUF883 family protein [Parasphingorhabdus sp.]|uniref:DUF883 family protein n=1 Tax=Parasphingorhabdus sp. TaxID=2709688 RepID=UPI002F94FCA6